jgi:hypothetical protein
MNQKRSNHRPRPQACKDRPVILCWDASSTTCLPSAAKMLSAVRNDAFNAFPGSGVKRGREIAGAPDVPDHQTHAHSAGSLFQLPHLGLLQSGPQDTRARERVRLSVASFSSSRRFAARPEAMNVNPVTLPPGRARLATSPVPTGSPSGNMTMGIVRVA